MCRQHLNALAALLAALALMACEGEGEAAAGLAAESPGSESVAALPLPASDVALPPPGCEPLRIVERLDVGEVEPAAAWLERQPEPERVWLDAAAIRDVHRALGREVPVPSEDAETPERPALSRAFVVGGALERLGDVIGSDDATGLALLAELIAPTGLGLPRQLDSLAQATTFHVDVTSLERESERALLLESAQEKGLVLLELADAALLYLGRDEAGRPWAWSAASNLKEEPCERGDGRRQVVSKQVQLLPLDLELDEEGATLLSRVERVHVLGEPPGVAFAGVATTRPPAPVMVRTEGSCRDSQEVAIYFSPRVPNPGQPMRVTVVSERDLGPVELVLRAPSGELHRPKVLRRGGPPWSYHAVVDPVEERGYWWTFIGEGEREEACLKARVRRRASALERTATQAVWELDRHTWTPAVENYYSAFVERLFDYPPEDDRTWESLHALLRDPERNILYDHLSAGEEAALELQPDCADLAYYLRGYFAWKIGLPFAFRRCTRGRSRRHPACSETWNNLTPREEHLEESALEALQGFLSGDVRGTVHSSSRRTHPDDEQTDFYPVPLTREALRPGVVFHDPYGHVMTVARWVPQELGGYGMLIAADAQPDGTIGRRRFWRGTFMFTPSTRDVGAGFKAFRPVYFDMPTSTLMAHTNEELIKLGERGRVLPFSRQQYEGSKDDFYDTVEALINPRPLDPSARLVALAEAFEEQVVRRVSSVENGEAYMKGEGYAEMRMPKGTSIFLTSGPWEDYSTPSRDMRLLIALDAVVGFPDAVARRPSSYGLEEGPTLDAAVEALRKELRSELEARSFTYTRSDGSTWTLTLADVADRAVAMEMAYNPNDCVELRWAAPEGSDERSTCARYAPEDQRERMREYRPWFHDRQRPR